MENEIAASFSRIKKWIGNPLSVGLLKFIAREDKCGSRLSLAIDYYLGEPVEACWKCRLAGRFVSCIVMEDISKDCGKCGPDLWNYAQEVRAGLLDDLIKAELAEAGIK